jgi:enediyne biosynthesis protein E4
MTNAPARYAGGRLTRRTFLRGAGPLACLLVPVFQGGRKGQPVLGPGPWFVDKASQSGLAAFRETCGSLAKAYLVETVGSGVAVFDYNRDGLLDLLFVNGSSFEILDNPRLPRTSSRLFRNNGDGTFTDVTRQSGLVNEGWGMGVAVADYDGDGHIDIFITNFGPNALFHNNGNGTFTNVAREAGVEGGNWSTGCAWGDYDGDGRLDLYVSRYVDLDRARIPRPGANSYCLYHGVPVACGPQGLPGLSDFLYHNEGNGKFREVSADVGVRDSNQAYGFSVVWCDFDNDGHLDAYVANDSLPNFLWHNKGNGTFEEVGMEAGCAVSGDGRAQSSMGVAVGDYDNDGWMDILVTNFAEDYDTLYHNHNGQFDDVSYEAGLGTTTYTQLGWGTAFVDFDNDGWQDLFIANGHIYIRADRAGNAYRQHNQMFRNLRDGRFALLPDAESGFLEARSSRGAAFGYLDNQGWPALVVNNIDDGPFFYAPASHPVRNWVRFGLEGAGNNRDAIGARVRVTAGGVTQTGEVRSSGSYLSSCDFRVHFGLGEAATVQRAEIRWPNGRVESHERLAVNREYKFRQAESR